MSLKIEKLNIQAVIPLIQQINVEGTIFKLDFYWRKHDDTVMVNLLDAEDNLLISDCEIRLNLPLFTENFPDKNLNIPLNFPQKLIVPFSDNNEFIRVGIDTLFINVHLYLVDSEYMAIKRGESYV